MATPPKRPAAEAIEEELIGSADKNITDVCTSVEAEYGAIPDDFVHMDGTDIGSLELSETQSQSVDGREPVTQLEDVPAQLEAEKARKAEKLQAAHDHRKKALEDKEPELSIPINATVPISLVSHDVEPELLVPINATVPISLVSHAKDRVAVRKLKKSELQPSRRSSCVAANSSPGDGGKRQSPRVIAIHKLSASPTKVAPVEKGTKAKQLAPKMKQPAATVKEPAAKGKKGPANGKQQAVVKGKKTDCNVKNAPRTANRSVRFEKDQDYVADDEDHDVEDDVSDESDDEADLANYEFVERSVKRKRGEAAPSSSVVGPVVKPRFNTTARCSLKEIALCIALLKDRHMRVLRDSSPGHLKDFTIKSNINRRLGCFLMYRVDPTTMTLDMGDGNKVLQITAGVIYKLFGLPRGNNSPPRPSDEHADALRKLKDELRIPRNKDIKIDDLRKILARLVEDPTNDVLAMKVFGLILFNKFICPEYFLRVKREATMVEDFDFVKLKDMQLCQLVDELKRAIEAWQAAGADWRAIPGCCIVLILAYLESIDHCMLNGMDKQTPRALYFDPKKRRKLANLDCRKKGGQDPKSWIYGKLPWKSPNDIVYFDKSSRVIGSTLRASQLKKSVCTSLENVSPPKRVFSGSNSATGVGSEGSTSNFFESTFAELDAALSRAAQLSL